MSVPQQTGECAAELRARPRRVPLHARRALALSRFLYCPLLAAVTATGLIWSRYATQITPVNYNLLSVNFFMALTGVWHLSRMFKHYYMDSKGERGLAGAGAGAGAGDAAAAVSSPASPRLAAASAAASAGAGAGSGGASSGSKLA